MRKYLFLFSFAFSFLSLQNFANADSGKYFDRVIIVVFENTNYSEAMKESFFTKLANEGANFTNFNSLTHPSQPNYIGLTSGSINGITNDSPKTINVQNITDLLEEKNISWKVYAEDYPGNCYQGAKIKEYARKHNPFISFLNVQSNPSRCAKIVNSSEFATDAANNSLPEYVFYIPNLENDGHDTSASYANNWYEKTFGNYINDAKFMDRTILVTTFDENEGTGKNQIYTSIFGPQVQAGSHAENVNLYSLLALIEDNWGLGSLNKQDASAPAIPDIWK